MAASLLASPWTSREAFLNQLGAGLGGQYNLYTAPKASRGYAGDFTIGDLTPYQYTAQEFAGDNGMMDVQRTGYKSASLDQLFGQGGWEIVSGGQSDGYNTPAMMLRTRTMADPTSSTGHPGSWNGTIDPATGKLTGLQWINDDLSSGVIGNTFDKIGAAVTSPIGGPLAVLAAPYVFGSAFGAGAAGSGGATAADIAAAAGQPELGMVGQTGLTAGGAPITASSPSWIAGIGSTSGMTPAQVAGAESLLGAGTRIGGGGMDWGSLLSNPQTWLAGGQLVSGWMGADAARDAADQQAQAAREANQIAWNMFQQNRADLEPWRQAGVGALGQLTAGTQPGADFNRNFRLSDYLADPGYQFRLTEGQNALENSAAARGGLLSGNTLKAITNYGQNAASQEFGNAYNRWNNDTSNRFNRLSGLAGTGQQATTNVASMGQNTAGQVGQNTIDIGNARAAGRVGSANAWNNTLGGLQSMYTLSSLLNQR